MKTLNLKNIYVADLETTHPENPYYDAKKGVSVYNSKMVNIKNHNIVYESPTIQGYIHHICSLRCKYIFFHNLSYDIRFIIRYLVYDCGYELVNEPCNKEKQIQITQSGEQRVFAANISFPNLVKRGKKWFKCYFACSYLKTQMSVKDLGKFSKYGNKMEIDHLKVNYYNLTQEDHDYCLRDVLVVADTLLNILNEFKSVESKKQWLKSLTLSQSIFEKLMRAVKFDEKVSQLPNNYIADCSLYYLGRLHYSGAFCQLNHNIHNQILQFPNKDAIIIDAVSMYPSIMMEKIAYKLLDKIESYWTENIDYVISYHLKITKATLIGTIPCLKSYDDQRYLKKYKGHMEQFLFKDEWELIKQNYHIKYEIKEQFYWKIDYLERLQQLIKNLFITKTNIKNQIKLEPNNLALQGKYESIKREINSLYGKFCQKKDLEMMIYSKEELKKQEELIIDDRSYYIVKVMTQNSIVNDYFAYQVRAKEEKEFGRNIIIGAWITSQARIKLLTLINKHSQDFIYCDTDSLFLRSDKCLKDIIIGEKLGQWEIQATNITELLITGPKAYEYYYYKNNELKRVIKKSGIMSQAMYALPKWGMQFKDDENITIKKAKLRPHTTKYGKVLMYQDIIIKNNKELHE